MYEIYYSQPGADRRILVDSDRLRSQNEVKTRSWKATTKSGRFFHEACGYFFLGLAILGAILPVLPTTPFLILASGCFMRSNSTMHIWLKQLPGWGPALRDWERHRAVRPRTKALALGLMLGAVGLTIGLARLSGLLTAILLVAAATGALVIHRLPVLVASRRSLEPSSRRAGKPRMRSRPLVGGN